MSIRIKTLSVISVALLALACFMYAGARLFLVRSAGELEQREMHQNVDRALNTLSNEVDALDTMAMDYGYWDDTYKFIDDHNEEYEKSNLADEWFTSSHINFIVYVDHTGHVVFAKAVDLDKKESSTVPADLLERFASHDRLTELKDEESRASGIMMLKQGPYLVVSRPILPTEGKGIIHGTLIVGRALDASRIERMSHMTQLKMTFYRNGDPSMPPDVLAAGNRFRGGSDFLAYPRDEDVMMAYAPVPDLYGNPALTLCVEVPRDFHKAFSMLLRFLLYAVVGMGAVACVLVSVLLDRLVLSRLIRLNAFVNTVHGTDDLSGRIALPGKDELAALGSSVNAMFESLGQHLQARDKAEQELRNAKNQLEQTNRRLEEAIERSDQLAVEAQVASAAKSQFLANMSHEIRTPMNSIIGFSEVLEDQYFGPLNEKQLEYLKDILESAKHLLSLINDILDLSKVEAGKTTLEISLVPVAQVLRNSLSIIKEKAMRHQIRLEAHITAELEDVTIEADERKLKQIMFNLLSNAAKFTPDGGSITVMGERHGEGMLVQVSDTGFGISQDHQKRVFDAFYQVGQSLSGKAPGTGLGLSLTKRFVELHGGRIWVESVPGEGSTFCFILPAKPPTAEN